MSKNIFAAFLVIILLAVGYFVLQIREQDISNTPVSPTSTITVSISPTATNERNEDEISWDMFVEAVEEERVGFMNARLLLVNEGHVVRNIYITDKTEISGSDVTIDNLEELEGGTPVRIIGTSAEGGIVAQQLIIEPEDHSPEPLFP